MISFGWVRPTDAKSVLGAGATAMLSEMKVRPGTNPGTGTAYVPTAVPTVGPYALPVPVLVPGSGSVLRVAGDTAGAAGMLLEKRGATGIPRS